MERSNRYWFLDSRAAVAKVVENASTVVKRSKEILLNSTVNTFLGRRTQEPFPVSSEGLDLKRGDRSNHASQISAVEQECHNQAALTGHDQTRQELQKMELECKAMADWLERQQASAEPLSAAPSD